MSTHVPKPEHEIAYQDLAALLKKHADKLTGMELVAVAANMLGKLVAMQDQRTVTPEIAMEVVAQNIELGNQQVFDLLSKPAGSA